MREAVSKAAMSLGVVRQAGKLFDCPRVLKNCFNAYVLFSLECGCRLRGLIGLLDSVVRSAERLCEGDLCCLGHRRKVSSLCLLYKTTL